MVKFQVSFKCHYCNQQTVYIRQNLSNVKEKSAIPVCINHTPMDNGIEEYTYMEFPSMVYYRSKALRELLSK